VFTLTPEQRTELEARARRYTLPYRDVVRARIVLMAVPGIDNDEITARLDTRREIVSKWRKRLARLHVPDIAAEVCARGIVAEIAG
jgi:hypothetical protein